MRGFSLSRPLSRILRPSALLGCDFSLNHAVPPPRRFRETPPNAVAVVHRGCITKVAVADNANGLIDPSPHLPLLCQPGGALRVTHRWCPAPLQAGSLPPPSCRR